jgi:outer membrane protein assembly factor BamB
LAVLLFAFCGFRSEAQTAAITTSQYSNARTGANSHEKTLTPANVNAAHFGKLQVIRVDGDVYAQPLYLPQVDVPGEGKRNILFIATEHDSVYAFDASGNLDGPLWHVSFVNPQAEVVTIHAGESGCPMIRPEIGITSTPVIDPATGTLYVLVRSEEHGRPMQRLHALALTTGAEKFGGPVEIRASGFDPMLENPRAALLLAGNTVYLGWGSTCDFGDYHGWLMAYDAHTLKQLGAFDTAPKEGLSGIWAADAGFAADADGNIFVATGNGKFDVASGGSDYGDSLLKMSLGISGLSVRDYFTPYDAARLNATDKDLGSGGPVLLPDQPGAHPHLVVIGGKGATLYLLDRDQLGKFHSEGDTSALQKISVAADLLCAPAFWQNHLFVQSDKDALKDYTFKNGQFSAQPVAQTSTTFAAAATPTVSSDGARNGIVWTVETRPFGFSNQVPPAVLHAYDAANMAHELYSSSQDPSRDGAGPSLRFTIPTVVNGRVYVGAIKEVDVYGLRPSARK